jgi:hypothetical protein
MLCRSRNKWNQVHDQALEKLPLAVLSHVDDTAWAIFIYALDAHTQRGISAIIAQISISYTDPEQCTASVITNGSFGEASQPLPFEESLAYVLAELKRRRAVFQDEDHLSANARKTYISLCREIRLCKEEG